MSNFLTRSYEVTRLALRLRRRTWGLGADVWRLLLLLAVRGRPVHLQWVPAHCGVAGKLCRPHLTCGYLI